jgi:hypothetical protein
MRTLTDTLLSAQKKANRIPAISVQARNLMAGVVNLKWERLYTGNEMDSGHAMTMPEDGSLIRTRTTPATDSRKLYMQRVTDPNPGSDFSQWTYLSQYNVMAVAACCLGTEVSLFWLKNNAEINRQRSMDSGATWQSIDYPGYAPTGTGVTQAAAAYKTNGDLALFFTDTNTLSVIKRTAGVWQSRVAWDKTTGNLNGVATIYDGDWKLLVSGQDSAGNFKVWSLIYGDGGQVAAGNWSALKEIASAPSDSGYEYSNLFLDKPDVYRCFFSEKYTGSQAYNRPFWSHTLTDTTFLDNRWREPVPFNLDSQYGLAVVHAGTIIWVSYPGGVWRGNLIGLGLNLSKDVLVIKKQITPDRGEITIELQNSHGQHAAPGNGAMSILDTGCQIDFSPGYRTAAGNEYSEGLSFTLDAYEYTSAGGKASLVLYASDGWNALEKWIARSQFRWNRDTAVKEILAQILARSGLKLYTLSESTVITGFTPDFTIHPGDNGKAAINRLLSFVPDVLFMEGNNAYLVNPLAADAAVYSYGSDHVIFEGRYRTGAWQINRTRVEGAGILAESFCWEEIQKRGDILALVEDLNMDVIAKAVDRAAAWLRKAEIESLSGFIRTPVNCGQQLYDVVAITDPRAGLSAAKKRILGITLTYLPAKAEYEQKLNLGAA